MLLQGGGSGQQARQNAANNAASAAIFQAVRGTLSPRDAGVAVQNAAAVVPLGGKSFPIYFISNDPASGPDEGFFLNDAQDSN
jgi:hypothetical protein